MHHLVRRDCTVTVDADLELSCPDMRNFQCFFSLKKAVSETLHQCSVRGAGLFVVDGGLLSIELSHIVEVVGFLLAGGSCHLSLLVLWRQV